MKAQTTQSAPIEIAARHGITTAILSLALFFAGCGGGGGSSPAAVNGVASAPPAANTFAVTSDTYGMQNPTLLASSKSSLGIVLRAAIASSMTDQNFKTVSRIDIAPGAALSTFTTYSLGAAAGPAFPGAIYFLNGHPSTQLRTVDGSITFTAFGANSGNRISGSYNAVVEDGYDTATPKARYTVAANFDFTTDSNGPVADPSPGLALAGSTSYSAYCASCHALGAQDTTSESASDLALKGGKLNALFTAEQPGHQGLRLGASQLAALQVLLNSN